MDKPMTFKIRLLKELGFLIISALLVFFSFLVAGTFFEIWVRDYRLLSIMVLAFYLIISFYRLLNGLAKRYRDDRGEDQNDVKKG